MNISTVEVRVPDAEDVTVTEDTLTAELSDGRTISVPLAWYPRLVHATEEERGNWRLIGGGQGIHWPDLDEDVSVEGLLAGRPSSESQKSLQRWLEAKQAGRGVTLDALRSCRRRRAAGQLMVGKMQTPAGWQVVRLGDVAEVVMGQSPPGETVIDWDGDFGRDDGLPFIQGNAEFGVKSPRPLKWCVQPVKVAIPRRLGILISVRAPVGQTNRASEELSVGRGLAAIRFSEPSQAFGWHIVNHTKGALERVTQGSTFQAIGGEALRSLPILLPPLSEQQAIRRCAGLHRRGH